jgi:hypothetical protein
MQRLQTCPALGCSKPSCVLPLIQKATTLGVKIYCGSCTARLILCDCCSGFIWDDNHIELPSSTISSAKSTSSTSSSSIVHPDQNQDQTRRKTLLGSKRKRPSTNDSNNELDDDADAETLRICPTCNYINTTSIPIRRALHLPNLLILNEQVSRILQRGAPRIEVIKYHQSILRQHQQRANKRKEQLEQHQFSIHNSQDEQDDEDEDKISNNNSSTSSVLKRKKKKLIPIIGRLKENQDLAMYNHTLWKHHSDLQYHQTCLLSAMGSSDLSWKDAHHYKNLHSSTKLL